VRSFSFISGFYQIDADFYRSITQATFATHQKCNDTAFNTQLHSFLKVLEFRFVKNIGIKDQESPLELYSKDKA